MHGRDCWAGILSACGGGRVSERYARSCAHKKHYPSERRAADAAKESQRKFGIPMNAYECEFHPKQYVIGSTFPWNSRSERREREGVAA